MNTQGWLVGFHAALALARECKRDRDKFDDEWRAKMDAAVVYHRKRARWYLDMHRGRNWHHEDAA